MPDLSVVWWLQPQMVGLIMMAFKIYISSRSNGMHMKGPPAPLYKARKWLHQVVIRSDWPQKFMLRSAVHSDQCHCHDGTWKNSRWSHLWGRSRCTLQQEKISLGWLPFIYKTSYAILAIISSFQWKLWLICIIDRISIPKIHRQCISTKENYPLGPHILSLIENDYPPRTLKKKILGNQSSHLHLHRRASHSPLLFSLDKPHFTMNSHEFEFNTKYANKTSANVKMGQNRVHQRTDSPQHVET